MNPERRMSPAPDESRMDIRTILVHLDNAKQARVATAAELALRHETHLIGLTLTGRVVAPIESAAVLGLGSYEDSAMRLFLDCAQVCVDDFERQMRRLGGPGNESRAVIGGASTVMADAAKHADLTIFSQLDPDEVQAEQSAQMPHDALLQPGRPLLVLPYAGEWMLAPPFMKRAANVAVAVFETQDDFFIDHGQVPGEDIGLWLARHGVKVEVKHVPAKVAAGEALLSHAADIDADLIVAGGYGHSRLRQSILGSVTRTLLSSSPVPVLLSH